MNEGGATRGIESGRSGGGPPPAPSGAAATVADQGASGPRLSMEAPELGPGLVERLEQLATCPLCGGPFEDPVLLACEHSFCRACLARCWGTPAAPGSETAPPSCPCCGQPCPRRSLRSNVRLAVEVRISRGLREKLAEPGARTGRRRGGRIPTMGCLDPHGEVRRSAFFAVKKRSRGVLAKSDTRAFSSKALMEMYVVDSLALGRQRQEDCCKFESILVHIANSNPEMASKKKRRI